MALCHQRAGATNPKNTTLDPQCKKRWFADRNQRFLVPLKNSQPFLIPSSNHFRRHQQKKDNFSFNLELYYGIHKNFTLRSFITTFAAAIVLRRPLSIHLMTANFCGIKDLKHEENWSPQADSSGSNRLGKRQPLRVVR
jgi:hypothetical protein